MYAESMWFDLEHATDTLGWRPRWATDDMFAESYDWYLAHRHAPSNDAASQHRRTPTQGVLAAAKRITGALPLAGGGAS